MLKTQSPKLLWDHCLELEALIRSHTAHGIYALDGETPEWKMKGSTADISQICKYSWYEWVMFRDSSHQDPKNTMILRRYFGPSIDVGSAMTTKILKENGEIMSRSTLRSLSPTKMENPAHIDSRKRFDASITLWLIPNAVTADFNHEHITPEFNYYDGDNKDGSPRHMPETPPIEIEPTPEVGDNYVNVEIMLPRSASLERGRVVSRKRDADGNPVGNADTNPILDSCQYEVLFDNGEVTELTVNVIATSMYARCDPDGNQYVLFDSFVDYRKKDTALSLPGQKIVVNGWALLCRSTVGWQLCCKWKDGLTSWEKPSDMKKSHPIETAEYAKAQEIDHEPAFNFWVPHVLKKREGIISLVKQRDAQYLKRTHKFGIEVPKSVKDTYDLDKKNDNTFWAD